MDNRLYMYFSVLIKGVIFGAEHDGLVGHDLVSVLMWGWVSDGEGALG